MDETLILLSERVDLFFERILEDSELPHFSYETSKIFKLYRKCF